MSKTSGKPMVVDAATKIREHQERAEQTRRTSRDASARRAPVRRKRHRRGDAPM